MEIKEGLKIPMYARLVCTREMVSRIKEKPGTKILPSLSPRGQKLKEELLSKILPWQQIAVSFTDFPYYIDEQSKTLLVECVGSSLKHKNLRKYGSRLKHSSRRILLQTIPGTELYRERVVSAVARELQVPLLKLDDEEGDDDDNNNDNYDDDVYDNISVDDESDGDESDEEVYEKETSLKKGDRVKYMGTNSISLEGVNNRKLWHGQRGEVYEVDGERVAVVFNICGLRRTEEDEEEEEKENETELLKGSLVVWLDGKHVKRELEVRVHDSCIAMEVLYEVLESQQPLIVYFSEHFFRCTLQSDSLNHEHVIKCISYQLPEGLVMICGSNKSTDGLKENQKFAEHLSLEVPRRHKEFQMHRVFTNVVSIEPPKEEDLLNKFLKQIKEDKLAGISKHNLKIMHKVLKDHNMSCMDLDRCEFKYMILTREKAEKIVGWARNHYLSSCQIPCVNEGKLQISYGSIQLAILRLEEEENPMSTSKDQSKRIQELASGYYEESLVSAVVLSEDIGVKFDDVGALEHVKKLLFETVILPVRRPELFSHGNLLKPCKGILLFGPPGTGKTLMAKAIATESGANFINITAATITSMYVGETENLTRAVFTFARKLAPVIIFIDEVDSLLGARDGKDKYSTSRLNEFMAGWDGLNSKDSHRILVIGATNRPFDLDDAVLRRMPRRIYVGLPDVENRLKILKILLNKENLESGFLYKQLAKATEGYSGSDLKSLCVAAAYRPIQEFLEQESKGETSNEAPVLRPLGLNDFLHAKSKVRPSVSEDATSIIKLREWSERYGEGGES